MPKIYGCGFGWLSAEEPDDNPADKSADPWDDPPDEPSEAFNTKLVIPPTSDVITFVINPKKSEPLQSWQSSVAPAFLFACLIPETTLCKNKPGFGGFLSGWSGS